jgi:hypothetical protein
MSSGNELSGGSVDAGTRNKHTVAVVRHLKEGVKLKFRHLFGCTEGTMRSRSRKRKTR